MNNLMQKRVFGMPLPVVMGVVVAGLLLGIYLRRRSSSSSGSLAAPQTSYPLSVGTDGGGSLTDALAGGGLPQGSQVSALDPNLLAQLQGDNADTGQAISTLTTEVQGLTDTIGGLVYQIGSSGGSGSSDVGGTTPASSVVNNYYTTATKPSPKKKQPAPPKKKAPAPVAKKAAHPAAAHKAAVKAAPIVHHPAPAVHHVAPPPKKKAPPPPRKVSRVPTFTGPFPRR